MVCAGIPKPDSPPIRTRNLFPLCFLYLPVLTRLAAALHSNGAERRNYNMQSLRDNFDLIAVTILLLAMVAAPTARRTAIQKISFGGPPAWSSVCPCNAR